MHYENNPPLKTVKINRIFSLLVTIILGGCAYPLQIHSRDGSGSWSGIANSGNKSMTINLEGVNYTGNYIFDNGSVATTNVYGTVNAYGSAKPATAHSQSYGTTYIPGSNQGQAFLLAPDGKSLRCRFTYIGNSGLGECQSNNGKVYDLVIGPPS